MTNSSCGQIATWLHGDACTTVDGRGCVQTARQYHKKGLCGFWAWARSAFQRCTVFLTCGTQISGVAYAHQGLMPPHAQSCAIIWASALQHWLHIGRSITCCSHRGPQPCNVLALRHLWLIALVVTTLLGHHPTAVLQQMLTRVSCAPSRSTEVCSLRYPNEGVVKGKRAGCSTVERQVGFRQVMQSCSGTSACLAAFE